MKTTYRLNSWDKRAGAGATLDRSKILVGSDPRCDVVLDQPGISPHHCYLLIEKESVRVLDLGSTNGTFINGKRIRDGALFAGDTLTIADLAFNLEEVMSDAAFVNCEAKVRELSVAVARSAVDVPDRAGLTLVDQEYCDLELTSQDTVEATPFQLQDVEAGDALESVDAGLELVESRTQNKVEVVTYSSGQVLDVTFVDLKKGLWLSADLKKDRVWFPGVVADVCLVQPGGLTITCPEGFTLRGDTRLGPEHVFLTWGVHQISLRLVEQSLRIKPLPFLWRSREFYKEASKVAGSIFVPFLLLLLVTWPAPEPEPVKQLTVIYKPAPKQADGETSMQLAATEVTSQTENTGSKQTEQPNTKPQMAQASAAAAAAAAPAETAPAAAPAKPKAYAFKSSVSLDSVVADAATGATGSAGRAPASTGVKGFGASAGALAKIGTGQGMGVGTLGSDASGTAGTSAGAKGLVSKKGFDHSYLEPKTVVLGSMDPELLRKILQEYLPQFRHCYQQELMTSVKDLKGVVDLDFTISADGRVAKTNVKAKDARFTNKGTNCMASVLKIIEFPKPKGGGIVDVRQPLNFFAETEKI
jgi:hypothetical protein